MAESGRRAHHYGVPPLRWPDPWPSSSLHAMRAAIHARRAGREREVAAAAFAVAFGGGHALAQPRHVLAAAERAGLDPSEVERAIAEGIAEEELRAVTDEAHVRGVFGVPTGAGGGGVVIVKAVAPADELFWGARRLEEAAAALRYADHDGGLVMVL